MVIQDSKCPDHTIWLHFFLCMPHIQICNIVDGHSGSASARPVSICQCCLLDIKSGSGSSRCKIRAEDKCQSVIMQNHGPHVAVRVRVGRFKEQVTSYAAKELLEMELYKKGAHETLMKPARHFRNQRWFSGCAITEAFYKQRSTFEACRVPFVGVCCETCEVFLLVGFRLWCALRLVKYFWSAGIAKTQLLSFF